MGRIRFEKVFILTLTFCMMIGAIGCSKDNGNDPENLTPTDIIHVDNEIVESVSYTYNDYRNDSPKTFNVHEWEMNSDWYVIEKTLPGLYDFYYNDNRDGYVALPEMAAGEPVDVTKEYVGDVAYGIPEDAANGYAFKISLLETAVWEDGTPINADTYLYSMEQQLNPKMKNYRAGSYYSGDLVISNAQAYYKSGSINYVSVFNGEDYEDVTDDDMFFSLTQMVAFLEDSAKAFYEAGYESYFLDEEGVDLFEKYSAQDYYKLTEEAKADLLVIAKSFNDNNEVAYKEFCFYIGETINIDFSQVGIKKTGDYEITLILEKPISEFRLKYELSSGWLVYEDLYEFNKKETGGLIKTSYGSSVDSYMSCGPYKLTKYQEGNQIILEKNDNWYGYMDGLHDGMYQTTRVICSIIEDQSVALLLFLQGKLDRISLTAGDMATYRNSYFISYLPQSFTTKITFNTDYETLKKREEPGINKSILSYLDFRKAFSLCIDRSDFVALCTSAHRAGYGLFNYSYVYIPEEGLIYRDSDVGKNVLTTFYNVDSIDDITGFDRTEATKLFVSSYEAALAANDITENDIIEFEYLVLSSDDAYVKMINFFQESIDLAVVGTALEGKIKIKITPDLDYYDHMKQGIFDMSFSTWGGADMNPYSLMEVYCTTDTNTKNEYGFHPDIEMLTLTISGKEITHTYYDWYIALCDGVYAEADYDTRAVIMAGMELGLLQTYNTTPLYYFNTAYLDSHRIVPETDLYSNMLEYGGIPYMTYLYTDAEWETYCAENNNQLQY